LGLLVPLALESISGEEVTRRTQFSEEDSFEFSSLSAISVELTEALESLSTDFDRPFLVAEPPDMPGNGGLYWTTLMPTT